MRVPGTVFPIMPDPVGITLPYLRATGNASTLAIVGTIDAVRTVGLVITCILAGLALLGTRSSSR